MCNKISPIDAIKAKCLHYLEVSFKRYRQYLAEPILHFGDIVSSKQFCSDKDWRSLEMNQIANLPDQSAGSIICVLALSYVTNPLKTSEELYRILKSKGFFLVIVPYVAPLNFGGYWRFVPKTIREVFFKNMTELEIVKYGDFMGWPKNDEQWGQRLMFGCAIKERTNKQKKGGYWGTGYLRHEERF